MQDDNKKRKGQKRGERVPLEELGFKAKVYYGIETEYRRQRARCKAAKYGAENSKDCFMGRLRFTLNIAELSEEELENLARFKGIKKNQWSKARHIIYHSKEELHCAICLQKQFQAPQMTSCGHVFCWHCILMHHYKSLKACFCPVCNEAYEIQNVVSCQPFFTKAFKELQSNKISFSLKARKEGGSRVYDPETLIEDLNFARVARATPEKILQLFQKERREIQQNVSTCDDDEIKKWIQKVYSLSWQRIEKAQKLIGKTYAGHSHHRDHNTEGYIYSVLDEKERASLVKFYQQKSGRLIFLHPICDKIIRKLPSLPKTIEEDIVYWQEAQYNIEQLKKYKQISHITINQEIDLIIVNIEKLISNELDEDFREDFDKFRARKKEELLRQEREAERLSVEYEEQKIYLAKLKKMEESQFYDIYVPTPLDLRELENTSLFPSLIQTKSMPEPETQSQPFQPKYKKKQKPKLVLTEGDFPELLIKKEFPQLQPLVSPPGDIPSVKSEQIPASSPEQDDFPAMSSKKKQPVEGLKGLKRKLKKKKQKYVNVTEMFFKQEEQDEDY